MYGVRVLKKILVEKAEKQPQLFKLSQQFQKMAHSIFF